MVILEYSKNVQRSALVKVLQHSMISSTLDDTFFSEYSISEQVFRTKLVFSLMSVLLNVITQIRVLELKNKSKCYQRIDNLSMGMVDVETDWFHPLLKWHRKDTVQGRTR